MSVNYKKMDILSKKSKEEIAENITDINCLDCREFARNIKSSECMCEPVQEIFEREGFTDDEAGHHFEKARKKYLYKSKHGFD